MNGDRPIHDDGGWFSHQYLQRLQNSTDPGVDRCSTSLLEVFTRKFLPRKKELLAIRERENMKEINDILTVELTDADLGFRAGEHPTRTLNKTEKYLKRVIADPFVTFTQNTDGQMVYEVLPIIKGEKTVNGKHLVLFNDLLLNHISPVKKYSPCSLILSKEIREKNVVAGILYEEGCRWKKTYNQGKPPFFEFTEKKLREKLLYDKMEISENKTTYTSVENKHMRIDKIRELVLKPALAVLKEFFDLGKLDFYLHMTTFVTEAKKIGRPPKNNFRFTILNRLMVPAHVSVQDSTEQDQYDPFEEINNYTEIAKELRNVYENDFIEIIIKQVEALEADNPAISEEVLTKIREKFTFYKNRGGKQLGNILNAVLWQDFGIGKPPKNDKSCQQGELLFWPDSLEEKIKVMKENYVICDRAQREFELSQARTLSILENEFLRYCLDTEKPLKDLRDATRLFFNVIKEPWFFKKYGNEKRNNDTDTRTESDRLEEEALRICRDKYFG
jgi:hypothetical protein